MVSTAVLLITVSTLAAQISAIPTKYQVNDDPCEGKIHCFEKPADYPQKAIDDLVARSNLTQLHRKKRQVSNVDMNECVETVNEEPLFKVYSGHKSRNVVQSRWYDQKVPRVTCKTKSSCASFAHGKCLCTPIETKVRLLTTDKEGLNPEFSDTDLITGCYVLYQLD